MPVPEAAEPRRSWWRVVVGLVVVVVLTTGAFVALTTHEGATSAEGAVLELVDALEAGDLAGVLAVLPPGERAAIVEPLTAIAAALVAADLLGSSGDAGLDGVVPGVSVEVDGLELTSEVLDEQVTFVEAVGGTVEVTVDPSAIPDQTTRDAVWADAGAAPGEPLTWTRDLAVEPLVFGTVDEGGGWFVSIGYTVAEQVRRQAGEPLPDVETRPDAIGSTTPDEVIPDLFGALEARFPKRIAELVSPEEGRALYDYATLWLPGLEAAAAAETAAAEAGQPAWSFRVDDLVVSSSGTGAIRRTRIDRLDATLTDPGAGAVTRYQVDDVGCTTVTTSPFPPQASEPDARTVCPGVGWTSAMGVPIDPPEGATLVDMLTLDGLAGSPSLTVTERGGRWSVAPVRSVLDSLAEGIEATPANERGAWATALVALLLDTDTVSAGP